MISVITPDLTREVIRPIKIKHFYGGKVYIEAAPELYGLARELEKFDDPTSNAALALAWSMSADYLRTVGYADDKFRTRRDLIFEKTAANAKICENSIRVGSNGEYDNLTTIDPSGKICFATIRRGAIVSFAAAYKVEDGAFEICAETEPGSRGRGYATSNVCALSDLLVLRGEIVRYICAETNERSKRVALGAGFRQTGISYSYTVRRKES